MSKEYPRFLYSKEENEKYTGHFVVCTVFPKGLYKAEKKDDKITLRMLEVWENDIYPDQIEQKKNMITKWLKSQTHIVW